MELVSKLKGTTVRKTKFTAKDIELNCLRIKAEMEKTKVGTKEYETLQDELDKEQAILKKYRDARNIGSLADWVKIGGTILGFLFLIGLSREWPNAIKIGSVILKMFPFKGI